MSSCMVYGGGDVEYYVKLVSGREINVLHQQPDYVKLWQQGRVGCWFRTLSCQVVVLVSYLPISIIAYLAVVVKTTQRY